jgi:hypothetical protein
MLAVKYCNYNTKKELFGFLLERTPKKLMYAYSKQDLKFKREAPAREALQKGKYLFYNQNLITELIFDIDNISHLVVWDLDWIYKVFYEKFGLTIAWSCKTDNGIQFCVSLNTFYKLSKKQKQILKDFKEFIINSWELIDKTGSKRLKGWWRNPLTQKDFRYYGNCLTFKEILDFLKKNKLNIKQQFKAKIKQTHIKIYNKVGEGYIGNRNNFVWYNLMLTSNSKDFNTLFNIAKELNKHTETPLDNKELEKITKSVLKYNQKEKNFIFSNSKKAKWNIGVMGFEKIKNLSFEEYKQEVKRRQKMAGKERGKHNIINYVKPKAEATKEKVYKAIKKLKEQGEKVTILKVKELAKVSYASAQKYLKQAREEGII